MGGHGGLNILPQKSWHVYNQDNRETVARDEAKHEAEQKVLREKNHRAESEFRHAALLARVRGQPLEAAVPSGQQPLLDAGEVAAVPLLDAGATAQAVDAGEADVAEVQPAQAPPAKHDIMASKRAVQSPDGHFNFWRAEELRADNAEARADEVAERRRRGNPETQTSDARFDERFKLGHAMHGKGNMPWYTAAGSTLSAENAARALDGGQLLAAAAARRDASGGATQLEGSRRKHKHKGKDRDRDKNKSKHKDRNKQASLNLGAKQLKASVAAMRAEREAREAAERAREKQLLRRNFLG